MTSMVFNTCEQVDDCEEKLLFTKEELDEFQNENQKPYSFINNLLELNDEADTPNHYDSTPLSFECLVSRLTRTEN